MIQFVPVVKKTVSVPKTLLKFSEEKNCSINELEFTLEKYTTFVHYLDLKQDIPLEDHTALNKTILLDPNARIYQKYEIKIIPKLKTKRPYTISLSANRLRTKVVATIKAGSVFQKHEKLFEHLRNYIWQKKISMGLLIGVFEEQFSKQLKQFLENVTYGKKLPQDLKIVVAQGVDPETAVDSIIERVELYDKGTQRNYIDGVKKGEMVFLYKKARKGRGGRSCKGIYIDPRKPRIYPIPQINESIRVVENEEYLIFYANDSGYVDFKGESLKISKTVQLEEANFRLTGDLDAKDLNQEVSVEINHSKSFTEDAIGGGIKVDVKDLNVDGTIGATNLNAKTLNIAAQTHKNSKLEVEGLAEIQLHRGSLVAQEAKIDTLEGGKVTARDAIYVNKVFGGVLIAPKIYINEMLSNAKLYASELIEIKEIKGRNNLLTIDPIRIESYNIKKEETEQLYIKLTKQYAYQTKMFESKKNEHGSQRKRLEMIQERVLTVENEGKTPSSQDLNFIQEYQKKSQALQQIQEELLEQKTELEALQEKLHTLQDFDLSAEIDVASSYDGTTKVVFVDPQTSQELSKIPEGKMEKIRVKLNREGKRVFA